MEFGEESDEFITKVHGLFDSEKKMIVQEHEFYQALEDIRASILSFASSNSIKFYPLLSNHLFEISNRLMRILLLLEHLELDEARFEKIKPYFR